MTTVLVQLMIFILFFEGNAVLQIRQGLSVPENNTITDDIDLRILDFLGRILPSREIPPNERSFIQCKNSRQVQNNEYMVNRLSQQTDPSLAPLKRFCSISRVKKVEELARWRNVQEACGSGEQLPQDVVVANCETRMERNNLLCVHYGIFRHCEANGFQIVDERLNARFTARIITYDNCESEPIECGRNYEFLARSKKKRFLGLLKK